MPIHFCDPKSPWPRGTNENTNELMERSPPIRQWFPERIADLSDYNQADSNQVADALNDRPRNFLDYRTPAEVLADTTVGGLMIVPTESVSSSSGCSNDHIRAGPAPYVLVDSWSGSSWLTEALDSLVSPGNSPGPTLRTPSSGTEPVRVLQDCLPEWSREQSADVIRELSAISGRCQCGALDSEGRRKLSVGPDALGPDKRRPV